ncbi:MAG: phosphotransacetylase family protein [Thermoplasmata archaeon]|nr:phosphotransacetylase family protein [Thermoplasmata archaeon]
MKSFVFASNRKNAGKTTMIMGLARILSNKKIGYMKPFGERVVYKKKRVWDYDAAAMTRIFKLDENPEDLSIGFDHSKLLYMYDAETVKEKVKDSFTRVSDKKDYVFIEGGKDLCYGCSVYLDSFSVANYTDSKVIYVASIADEFGAIDELYHLKNNTNLYNKLTGVIINKVESLENWQDIYQPVLEKIDIHILGVIPRKKELEITTPALIAEQLFAKVVSGEEWLSNEIENIFIGAMSASAAIKNPLFNKKNKLIITSGDRTDIILASVEHDTSCLLLTNNILPPSNIIEKANQNRVPILLIPWDTYTAAKRVESIKALLNEKDLKKLELVENLLKEHIDLSFID